MMRVAERAIARVDERLQLFDQQAGVSIGAPAAAAAIVRGRVFVQTPRSGVGDADDDERGDLDRRRSAPSRFHQRASARLS